jgi:opacity protein-like surface antigen
LIPRLTESKLIQKLEKDTKKRYLKHRNRSYVMKKVLLFVVLGTLIAATASAQMPEKPLVFYLSGGVSMPQSDFKDFYKMGFQGSAGLGLRIIPLIEAVGRVSYHSFEPDWGDDVEVEPDGGRFSVLLYGAEGKVNLGEAGFTLFALAGAGGAKLDISDIESDGQSVSFESETKSYFTIGAGLEFSRVFVEARYVKILDELDLKSSELFDVDEEQTTVFMPLSIGLKF